MERQQGQMCGAMDIMCMQACERVLTKIQPHQRVNCVPGIASLARKNRLIATLVQHYGEGAFEMTPRSWLLPEQYWHWRLRAEAQASHFNPLPALPCRYHFSPVFNMLSWP